MVTAGSREVVVVVESRVEGPTVGSTVDGVAGVVATVVTVAMETSAARTAARVRMGEVGMEALAEGLAASPEEEAASVVVAE